jgi:hypothetical protein
MFDGVGVAADGGNERQSSILVAPAVPMNAVHREGDE